MIVWLPAGFRISIMCQIAGVKYQVSGVRGRVWKCLLFDFQGWGGVCGSGWFWFIWEQTYGNPRSTDCRRFLFLAYSSEPARKRATCRKGINVNFSKHRLSISILLLLLLTACNPAATPATTTPVQNIAIKIPNTSTVAVPTVTLETSLTPGADPAVYPYFLPLTFKPDVEPQTIDGVTTTIDWAYSDEGRVAIHYTITGLDWTEGTNMEPTQMIQMTSDDVPNLWMGGMSGNQSIVQQGVITGEYDQRLVYGALDQQKIQISVSMSTSRWRGQPRSVHSASNWTCPFFPGGRSKISTRRSSPTMCP